MKKVLFTMALALATSAAFAQFSKGRILAGGSIGFSSETVKSEFDGNESTIGKQTDITFTPQAGFFVMDNLAVGAGIALESSTFKPDGGDGKQTTSEFTFNPFARYYFGPGVFGQATVGFGSAKEEEDTGSTTTETKASVFRWNLGLGYAIFLNDNVAIEPVIGYGSKTFKLDETGDPKTKFGGLFLQVGIQAYLGAK
jgi:hypothetical protein